MSANVIQHRSRNILSRNVLVASGVALALAGLGALFWLDPAQQAIFPVCYFHKLTGLNCPGCGSLRAMHHLLHGRLFTAFHCNPLLMLVMPLILVEAARWVLSSGTAARTWLTRPASLWLMLAILVAFGILRNLPFPAFAWMSP